MAGSSDASNLVSSWDPFSNKWSRENYSAESVVRTKKWACPAPFCNAAVELFSLSLSLRDLAEIFKEKPHGIHAAPDNDDITKVIRINFF